MTYEIHEETRSASPTAVSRATLDVAGMPAWFSTAYSAIAAAAAAQGIAMAGPPFARYRLAGAGRFAVEAGFPVTSPVTAKDGVQSSELPGGLVATTVHVGPYDRTAPAYEALATWVRNHGGELADDPWEVYLSEPTGDPATWRTEIVQPYRLTR